MANKINQIEIDSIIYDLQDKDAKAPFTGTKAEVQLAIAAGEIKEGDIVNITDDIGDYPGGGDYPSGASNIVYLTQEAYDALSDDKLTNGIEYRIMDGDADETARNISYDNNESGLEAVNVQQAIDKLAKGAGSGSTSNTMYLTQAEYDELPESKLTDGVEYFITDTGVMGAANNVTYDNSNSGLEAINVQTAIDEVKDEITTLNESLVFYRKQYTASYKVSANGYANVSFELPEGYRALGLIYVSTGTANVYPYVINNTSVYLKNTSNQEVNANATIIVMLTKMNIIEI